MRSNQQVIQWLNKELNEAQTGGRPYVNLPSRVAAFKPALHPSIKPVSSPPGASATGTSTPSLTASLTKPDADSLSPAAAEGYVPGKALAGLKSRAGIAAAAEGTNTTGGLSEYLSP